MLRRRAVLQLRLIRAVVRHERRAGRATDALADHSLALLEKTAVSIEPEPDATIRQLIDAVRAEIAEVRDG